MGDDRCICGAHAWSPGEPRWCCVCQLPEGATEEQYLRLMASEFPPSGAVVPIPSLAGVGTPVGRLMAALRAMAPDGATAADLTHWTGDGYDVVRSLLCAGLARRRIVCRETAGKLSQGEKVRGAVRYRLREA